MIEAILMVLVGLAILYWAFWVSERSLESRRDQASRKEPDKT